MRHPPKYLSKFYFPSLNAIGSVARNNNYVRPTIVPGHHRMEIIDGRHPLVEILNDFVPNSTLFSSNERIQILTGPNASGKSIYLKQVLIKLILKFLAKYK